MLSILYLALWYIYVANDLSTVLLSSTDVNDFIAVNRTVTFDPAEPSMICIDVLIVDDLIHEDPRENFEGTIVVPLIPGVELGTRGTAVLVIMDNDGE